VTGAGSGIGRAIAVRFAAEGAHVAVTGRTTAPLEETARLCRAAGGDAVVVPFDVGDARAVAAAMLVVENALGALDGLVHSAGVSYFAALEGTDPGAWERVLRVNLTGPFLVTRAALPLLRRGSGPSVVMIASTLGLRGLAGASAYCAAKGGLVNLGRALAVELAPEGIRVNVVCPGVVDTPMLDGRTGARGRRGSRGSPNTTRSGGSRSRRRSPRWSKRSPEQRRVS
jgi:NAD(P)-dependent dehydrogenase (short-subunit alcohol dehydrogenase family)